MASEYSPSAQLRRKKVEMLFAYLKRILGLGRLRLRGPCGVLGEFTPSLPPKTFANWQNSNPWCPPPDNKAGQQETLQANHRSSLLQCAKTNVFFNKIDEKRVFGDLLPWGTA
jgi:hypothetical protein